MLSKDYRLRIVEMSCRIKLGRKVTLEERIWLSKLIQNNKHAENLARLHGGIP